MTFDRRVLAQAVTVAFAGYVVAGLIEAMVIRWVRPTELELAWVSDLVLAVAFGTAVYLWRHLLTTRRELAARERTELVLQSQLSVAADIQRRLLPDVPSPPASIDWCAALRSAGKIGGDFYDFVERAPGVWLVLVADVSGKGIPAAMALGSLRSAFRAFARERDDPAQVVTQLSETFHQEWLGAPYVTCLVVRLDAPARTLTCTNAGHPPGLVSGPRGTRRLTVGGPPAGLLPLARYDEERVTFEAGDVCLFVTDGVTEALEGQTSLERVLFDARTAQPGASAAELCRTVMGRALEAQGPPGVDHWEDDRTVVVINVS